MNNLLSKSVFTAVILSFCVGCRLPAMRQLSERVSTGLSRIPDAVRESALFERLTPPAMSAPESLPSASPQVMAALDPAGGAAASMPSFGPVMDASAPGAGLETPYPMSDLNDLARVWAGLPGGAGSRYTQLRRAGAWREHQGSMERLWRQYSQVRKPKVDTFSMQVLGPQRNAATVFYPFSGPDILFATGFFPYARDYILVGLEGTDGLPNWSALGAAEQGAALQGMQTSISTLLNCSFFITKDMRKDLQGTSLRGTLPIVLVFLARMGADILETQQVALAGNGLLSDGSGDGRCPGYRVTYRLGSAPPQRLFYFREDLSNETLNPDPRLLRFVDTFGSHVCFLKSASYLLHGNGFSKLRGYLLEKSQSILQDDSGVPYRYLASAGLRVGIYGDYTVIPMFRENFQPDLAAALQRQGKRDVNVGLGYTFENENSCLLWSTRNGG